jgi:1-acyl-sn-glycerol-3-phosphate acyltransferase
MKKGFRPCPKQKPAPNAKRKNEAPQTNHIVYCLFFQAEQNPPKQKNMEEHSKSKTDDLLRRRINPTSLKIMQKISWLFLRPILKFFIRYRFFANCDIKDLQSPLILVSNHLSYLDPSILGTVLPFNSPVYPIYFITKDTLMTAPVLGSFLKLFGAFRAWRGEGLQKALEEPRQILEAGYSLVIFPQGKRYSFAEFKLEQGRPGAATLALETKKMILPVAICSISAFSWKNFFLRRYSVRVIIGKPFMLGEKLAQNYAEGNVEVGTQIIMREIQRLMEQSS